MAAFSKHQNHGHGKPKADKSKEVECWNCQKKGHMQKDCWQKGGGKEGQGPKQKKAANRKNAEAKRAESSSNQEHCFKAVTHDVESAKSAPSSPEIVKRLFDSGASVHFETDRSNFIEIKSCAPLAIETATGKIVHGMCTSLRSSPLRSSRSANSVRRDCRSQTRLKVMLNFVKGMVPYSLKCLPFGTHTQSRPGSRLLGHASAEGIRTLFKEGKAIGLEIDPASGPRSQLRTKAVGELVHSDVWGPARTTALPTKIEG